MIAAGCRGVRQGLRQVPAPDGEGEIERFMRHAPRGPSATAQTRSRRPVSPCPTGCTGPPRSEAEPAPPLKPSSALAAADGGERPADGPFLAEAAAAGRLAHLLLQLLPDIAPAQRAATAAALAAARGSGAAGAATRQDRRRCAGAARASPISPALFAPGLAGRDAGRGRDHAAGRHAPRSSAARSTGWRSRPTRCHRRFQDRRARRRETPRAIPAGHAGAARGLPGAARRRSILAGGSGRW